MLEEVKTLELSLAELESLAKYTVEDELDFEIEVDLGELAS